MTIDTTFLDYPSPQGIAIIIYFNGCDFNCKGCQNSYLRDYITLPKIDVIINKIEEYSKKNNNTKQVVFSGGDSLALNNRTYTIELSRILTSKEYKICIYTGNIIEVVKNIVKDGLQYTYVKCGQYNAKLSQESIKNDDFIQFASMNQGLYDYNFNLLSSNGKYIFNKENRN